MAPETFLHTGIEPALSILPAAMDTPKAARMILAICLQETGLRNRLQIRGPARGWAQFERLAVYDVLTRRTSATHARTLCAALSVRPDADTCHEAIAWNDILCAGFARLNLWNSPDPIPDEVFRGLMMYIRTWRPGKPRPETWPKHWATATATLGL